MNTLLTCFSALFFLSPSINIQDLEFSFIKVETIVADLNENAELSEYFNEMDIFTLICFDERIRKAISAIDPENKNLNIECMDESDVYPDYEMVYKSEIISIRELFEDSDIIEKTTSYFDQMYRDESVEVQPNIWIKGEKEAIFQFYHGRFLTQYKVKIKEETVRIILLAIGVREVKSFT